MRVRSALWQAGMRLAQGPGRCLAARLRAVPGPTGLHQTLKLKLKLTSGKRADAGDSRSSSNAQEARVRMTRGATRVAAQLKFPFFSGPLYRSWLMYLKLRGGGGGEAEPGAGRGQGVSEMREGWLRRQQQAGGGARRWKQARRGGSPAGGGGVLATDD